jgi:Ca-activated chloride channel family protein
MNPVKRTAEEPVSTFSIDVDTAAYANVRRFLNEGTKPPRDAVRVEELVNYFDYGYARPAAAEQPFASYVAVTPSPWSPDRQILQIGLQGYEQPRSSQAPLNLVFLIDTSGSMESEDKLPLARKAMNILIDQLGPQDRVSMVAYAGSAGAVLAPTSGREKLKMRCALGALSAGGSTAGGQGLALAYGLARQNFDPKAVNRVILMTDGDFNVGVADPEKLKDFVAEKRRSGVYLSVYGFGRGNYNDAMMQTLAQNGNGTAGYLDTLSEARKVFRDDFSASLFPIADDVKIQVEFNPAQVSEYRLIGYETRLLNREDFNNDAVDAGEVGSGASVTALYEITPTGARPSSDPLRYGARRPAPKQGAGGELAFLKVRYKLPGRQTSRLMERPITRADIYASVDQAPEPTRWALAVAGFGQKLRGDPWVSDRFGWPQITALAQGARGQDPFGLRAEFVQLTRNAGAARSLNE